MRDVIERFQYRFELWRREWREDLFGAPRPESPQEVDYVSHFADPKHSILLTEPTLRSVGRSGVTYFGVIAIAAQILAVIASFIPLARFTLGIVFLVFVGIWSLVFSFVEIDLRKAREQYRKQQASKSTKQASTPTDAGVSIHEPSFTPSIPRFRQR